MIRQDLHTHTTFCDGKNTAEEMVLSAIEKGLYRIGFSGHSYLFLDEGYCLEKGEEAYKAEIRRLKEKYKDRIRILLGIEQDYFSMGDTSEYDYVIGSVHWVPFGSDWINVDGSRKEQIEGVKRCCKGDYYTFAEAYFSLVADVVHKTRCDIIGHFDLLTKFNAAGDLFDIHHPRYVKAWQKAADALLETDALFEINTGVIFRGYRKDAYPQAEILEYIRERGGRFILSGDCHNKEALCLNFEPYAKYVTELPPKFDI